MALSIQSPQNSFVQFGESADITSCNFSDIHLCLPVFEDDDVWFQFIITTDTDEEADALCDLDNALVSVGIAKSCEEDNLITFAEKPERFRIGDRSVLYNWQHGIPGFSTVIDPAECFFVKVTVDETEFCSNCFQRILDTCHTSVIEYGNEDDAFGFNYCNSQVVGGGDSEDCDPTFITFTNAETLTIPYTASMQAKYGNVPTIKVWIYDGSGQLVNMSVSQALDTYPPTQISIDFGGPATGVLKIS
jgi:hypothetical protein